MCLQQTLHCLCHLHPPYIIAFIVASRGPGSGAAAPSPGACNVSYADLAPPAARACASSPSSSAQPGNFTLRCPACAPVPVAPAAAPAAAAQPYCNGTQQLTGTTGSFSDGAPSGGAYLPGSFCQWVIDPNYMCAHPLSRESRGVSVSEIVFTFPIQSPPETHLAGASHTIAPTHAHCFDWRDLLGVMNCSAC